MIFKDVVLGKYQQKGEVKPYITNDPADQPIDQVYPIQTVEKHGKSKWFTPGWWNKQANKLDNVAFGAGFVPVVGDAVSFLADVGANLARYQYDKGNTDLPEWQRKEIAKSNLKSGLGLAGAGAMMGLFGTSMPSGKIKGIAKKSRKAFGPDTDYHVNLEDYVDFDDITIQKSELPAYAQEPSADNLKKSTELLKKRFNYKDWLERVHGRKLNDEEINTLRKKYPEKVKINRDKGTNWGESEVLEKTPGEVHIGEAGIHEPEIEETITAHEIDHALGIPELTEDEIQKSFGDFYSSYLKEQSASEMFARLGQIANWYGLTDISKQPMTGNMLKYAANKGRYVKDAKFDNNMYDFFNTLKQNNKWESAAKAYNQYGKSIVPPALLIGSGAAYNRFKQNDNENKIKFVTGGPISRYGSCR